MRPVQPLSPIYSAMQLIGKYLNNIACIDTRPGIPQDGGNQSNANGSCHLHLQAGLEHLAGLNCA
ncbi:MAG: hypothetical protein WCR20_20275 [Verrucomicrobiota bacterium]